MYRSSTSKLNVHVKQTISSGWFHPFFILAVGGCSLFRTCLHTASSSLWDSPLATFQRAIVGSHRGRRVGVRKGPVQQEFLQNSRMTFGNRISGTKITKPPIFSEKLLICSETKWSNMIRWVSQNHTESSYELILPNLKTHRHRRFNMNKPHMWTSHMARSTSS